MLPLLLGVLLLVSASPVRPVDGRVTIDDGVIEVIFGKPADGSSAGKLVSATPSTPEAGSQTTPVRRPSTTATTTPTLTKPAPTPATPAPTPATPAPTPATPAPTPTRPAPTPLPLTFLINKDNEEVPCKCVPYYMCDDNLNDIDSDNTYLSGWGKLDVRFGDDECQESVELCCRKTREPDTTPEPPILVKENHRGCGYSNPKGLDREFSTGSDADAQFGEYPWVVALLDHLNGSYVGMGVLIHPQVVMTTAHVAIKYTRSQLRVRAGEWDTQTIKERLPYQEKVVSDIYIHNDFVPKRLYNDIALLRLESPVQLADHINVICMPEQEEEFDRARNCVANGWGKHHFGEKGLNAVFLKKVEQDILTHSRCNLLMQRTRLGRRFSLHGSFVCAGGEEGKDTCQGDGGGPLACPIGDDRYKLTGLVAWGIGCGQKDVPAVYVSVSLFRQWVDEKMTAWGFDTAGYTVPPAGRPWSSNPVRPRLTVASPK